ncbi:MAG TPA: ribose-phosphate pyrophosphokinase [Bacteroidetes bacterium]|nr:ribose-phosphate pyrophosphokinase [Bacteroidota bacterium]
MKEIKIFSGTATKNLAEKIANDLNLPLGDLDVLKFSDGEMQVVLNESVRGAHVFFIQSTFAPGDNIIELLLMIDAAKRASAGYITAVIPYFGYARQDRKDKPRVPISAKLMANIIQASGVDRVMTMDLHAQQIQGFFDIPVDHLIAEAIFFPFLEQQEMENTIFASPDVGGVKRARAYARKFDKEFVICDKERKKANEVANIIVIGDVKGKDVILIDDLVDTAGTMTMAADKIMEEGAKSVKAICTHPVLSGPAYERLQNSQISQLIVSDTIPLKKNLDKIKIISCSHLFAEAINYVYEFKSIQSLFNR